MQKQDKKQLRKTMLNKRAELDEILRKEWSATICKKVISSREFSRSRNIMIYYPFKSEVDTSEILRAALASGKNLYIPKITSDTEMIAAKVDSLVSLVAGRHGILQPQGEEDFSDSVDLAVVPLSCADRQFNRLGMGKGYYDRFLRGRNIFKMAVCFDMQVLDDVPIEEFDIKMDMIVTEREELVNEGN